MVRLCHAGASATDTCILLEFNGGLMALAWKFHALHYVKDKDKMG